MVGKNQRDARKIGSHYRWGTTGIGLAAKPKKKSSWKKEGCLRLSSRAVVKRGNSTRAVARQMASKTSLAFREQGHIGKIDGTLIRLYKNRCRPERREKTIVFSPMPGVDEVLLTWENYGGVGIFSTKSSVKSTSREKLCSRFCRRESLAIRMNGGSSILQTASVCESSFVERKPAFGASMARDEGPALRSFVRTWEPLRILKRERHIRSNRHHLVHGGPDGLPRRLHDGQPQKWTAIATVRIVVHHFPTGGLGKRKEKNA